MLLGDIKRGHHYFLNNHNNVDDYVNHVHHNHDGSGLKCRSYYDHHVAGSRRRSQ